MFDAGLPQILEGKVKFTEKCFPGGGKSGGIVPVGQRRQRITAAATTEWYRGSPLPQDSSPNMIHARIRARELLGHQVLSACLIRRRASSERQPDGFEAKASCTSSSYLRACS